MATYQDLKDRVDFLRSENIPVTLVHEDLPTGDLYKIKMKKGPNNPRLIMTFRNIDQTLAYLASFGQEN